MPRQMLGAESAHQRVESSAGQRSPVFLSRAGPGLNVERSPLPLYGFGAVGELARPAGTAAFPVFGGGGTVLKLVAGQKHVSGARRLGERRPPGGTKQLARGAVPPGAADCPASAPHILRCRFAPREGSAAGVASFSSAGPHPPPGRVAFPWPETSRFFVGERDGAARGRRASGGRVPESQGMPGFGIARVRRGVLCPSIVEVGVAFSSIALCLGVFLCSSRLLDRRVGEARTRT